MIQASVHIGPSGAALVSDEGDVERLDSLTRHLFAEVALRPNCTIGDVWTYMDGDDAAFYSTLFFGVTEHSTIEPWLRESRTEPTMSDPGDPPRAAAVYRVTWDSADLCDQMDALNDVSLTAGIDPVGEGEDPDVTRHELSRLRVCDVLASKLEIDDLYRVRSWEINPRSAMAVGTTLAAISRPMLVIDLLAALLREVSMLGTPRQRESRISQMDQLHATARDGVPADEGSEDVYGQGDGPVLF